MRQEEDTTTLAATDLSDEQKSALNILFQSGVPPSVISRVMTDLVWITSDKKGNPALCNVCFRVCFLCCSNSNHVHISPPFRRCVASEIHCFSVTYNIVSYL